MFQIISPFEFQSEFFEIITISYIVIVVLHYMYTIDENRDRKCF